MVKNSFFKPLITSDFIKGRPGSIHHLKPDQNRLLWQQIREKSIVIRLIEGEL